MRDFAIVKGIEGQRIEVVSLISDACLACNSVECAKQGKSFHVINKKNLPLKEDSIIRIGFPRVLSGFLGVISLVLPIFASVLGFLLSPLLLNRFGIDLNQNSRAVVTGIFFLFTSSIIILISRTTIHITHPEVIQIM